jgi:hypothetical protein
MSLYADPTGGNPVNDLETICWWDGNLGMGSTITIATSVGNISATQVTYSGGVTTGKDTATRLYTLATNDTSTGAHWSYPIVITPMNGGTNPFTGHDLSTVHGECSQAAKPLPAEAPEQLFAFAPLIKQAAELPLASWALLDPLVRAWTITTRHLDVIDEVSQWLATAPIETYVQIMEPEKLDAELDTLASYFAFSPAARLRMGSRLAAAWPEAGDALRRHGFVGKEN